jgi:quercetin dioxygenase-like cupin family protein
VTYAPAVPQVKRFDAPDEERTFPLGRLDLLTLAGMTIGRASYDPGWRWSEHVGAADGKTMCDVEHVGLVVSGRNLITMADGTAIEVGPGDVFHVEPGHDSQVVGDEPYVSLHFLGASDYAAK